MTNSTRTFTGVGNRWAEVEVDPAGKLVQAYVGAGNARMGSTTDAQFVLCWLTLDKVSSYAPEVDNTAFAVMPS